MNTQTVAAETPERPRKTSLEIVQHTYDRIKKEIMETTEDEESYLSLLSDFQDTARDLGKQARAVVRYSDDPDKKIRAQAILDMLHEDAEIVANMGHYFELAHEEAGEVEEARRMGKKNRKTCDLCIKIEETIYLIKHGRDAKLAVYKANEEALKEANETVRKFHQAVDKPRPLRLYPLPLPAPGERVPELPESFLQYMDLDPAEMELAENGTLQIPQGYKDKDGNDLTDLFTVDWESGVVSSELKPEETQDGKVKWAVWFREYPGQPRPPELHEYMQRLARQFFAEDG